MKIPSKAKVSVTECQKFLKTQGITQTEEQVFKKLIELNMLDRFGNPTQFALDNDLVEEVKN